MDELGRGGRREDEGEGVGVQREGSGVQKEGVVVLLEVIAFVL